MLEAENEQNRTEQNRTDAWRLPICIWLFLTLLLPPNLVFAEDFTTIGEAKKAVIEHALAIGYDLSDSHAEVISGRTAMTLLGETFVGESQKVLESHLSDSLAVVVVTKWIEIVWIPFPPDTAAAAYFQTSGAILPTGTIHRPPVLIGITKANHSACSGCRTGVVELCHECDFDQTYTLTYDVLDNLTLQQHGVGAILRWTETVGKSYEW